MIQRCRDSDSDEFELEVLRAQDENSDDRLQKGEAVFEKFHNSVVGHRKNETLKLSEHNRMGMKDQLKKYISKCAIG